ncbi:MAG: hypothetical protein U0746_08640 [Gemmataceae bacterium]
MTCSSSRPRRFLAQRALKEVAGDDRLRIDFLIERLVRKRKDAEARGGEGVAWRPLWRTTRSMADAAKLTPSASRSRTRA